MFNKKNSINLNDIKIFLPMASQEVPRIYAYHNGDLLVVSNDTDDYIFATYHEEELISTVKIGYSIGELYSVNYLCGFFWLEFRDHILAYEEEYSVIRLNGDSFNCILRMSRESYNHDLQYHELFEREGEVYLNIIRHNRVHQFHIGVDSVTEVDYLEGGQWYLCGKYSICKVNEIVEIYDEFFEYCNDIEYDYNIDMMKFSESSNGDTLAISFTDNDNEQSMLITYHYDSKVMYASYIEHAIADIGLSCGKIIVVPYSFDPLSDFGGLMVYDRSLKPLYFHMKAKHSAVGLSSPVFMRSYGVHQLPHGSTLILEKNKVTILDHCLRPIQELPICNKNHIGILSDKIFILKLDRNLYDTDGVSVHEKVAIDIYEWSDGAHDDKVIEMFNFYR